MTNAVPSWDIQEKILYIIITQRILLKKNAHLNASLKKSYATGCANQIQ